MSIWKRIFTSKAEKESRPSGDTTHDGRQQRRSFDAALESRLLASWARADTSVNDNLKMNLGALRARSRDLARNNPYAKKFLNLIRMNVVGPNGVLFQSQIRAKDGSVDQKLSEEIEKQFARWMKHGRCDVTGKLSFADVQRIVISSIARDGECFVRFVHSSEFTHGFSLELIDPSFVDESYQDGLGKKRVVMGVEINQWKRPVAYHVKRDPTAFDSSENIRVPASEMVHPHFIEWIDQLRGIPWMHAIMTDVKMLRAYQESEVTASRVAANKGGFFKTSGTVEYKGDEDAHSSGDTKIKTLEPGEFEELPPGMEFVPWNPEHPNGNFSDFMKACLRSVSCGLSVSYHSLTSDLSDANYSSLRAGLLEERELWKLLQKWFIEAFLEPVFREWLKSAVLVGAVSLPPSRLEEAQEQVAWFPRRWAWVDPSKDVTANVDAMEAGLKSRVEIAAEQGRDLEEIYKDKAREKELERKYGFSIGGEAKHGLEKRPRKETDAGSQPVGSDA